MKYQLNRFILIVRIFFAKFPSYFFFDTLGWIFGSKDAHARLKVPFYSLNAKTQGFDVQFEVSVSYVGWTIIILFKTAVLRNSFEHWKKKFLLFQLIHHHKLKRICFRNLLNEVLSPFMEISFLLADLRYTRNCSGWYEGQESKRK